MLVALKGSYFSSLPPPSETLQWWGISSICSILYFQWSVEWILLCAKLGTKSKLLTEADLSFPSNIQPFVPILQVSVPQPSLRSLVSFHVLFPQHRTRFLDSFSCYRSLCKLPITRKCFSSPLTHTLFFITKCYSFIHNTSISTLFCLLLPAPLPYPSRT